MRKVKGALYSIQKIFFGVDATGKRIKYNESLGYFTDLKNALKENMKHTNSFVFPFACKFHKDRRSTKGIIRANFSQCLLKREP